MVNRVILEVIQIRTTALLRMGQSMLAPPRVPEGFQV